MSGQPSDEIGPLTRAETAALWCARLAEGPLTASQQDEFADWLAADAAHGRAFEEAAATWREFDGAESAPEFLKLRVEALQQARRRLPAPPARMRWRWGLPAAAAALVVAAIAAWAWMSAPTVYRTGVAERRVAVLEDGSRISLDAATTVRVRYTANRRDLQLIGGRAKFDVAKDPLRPFSVAAGNKVVVATGTEFSVELLQRKVHVILYEGHVAVLQRDGRGDKPQPVRLDAGGPPAEQALVPGRELVVAESSGAASLAPTDPSRALSWEAGQLVFVDEPLSSAVERVNRYSHEKLAIGDPSAGQIRVTGVFTAGDVQAFVDGVSAAFPLKTVQQEGHRAFVSATPRG